MNQLVTKKEDGNHGVFFVSKLDSLKQKISNFSNYIKATIKSTKISLLIVQGENGLGKSYTVSKNLPSALILKNKLTALEFYILLVNNPKSTVILDDLNWQSLTEQIMSACNISKKRYVHYHTSTNKLKKTSEFKGKIIIITNVPKSRIPQALLSRAFFYSVSYTYHERILMLHRLAKVLKIPKEIARYIHLHSSHATEDLDFRKLTKIHELSIVFPNNWKEMAKNELNENEEKKEIIQLKRSGLTVQQQQRIWSEQFSKSRASYYSKKQELKK